MISNSVSSPTVGVSDSVSDSDFASACDSASDSASDSTPTAQTKEEFESIDPKLVEIYQKTLPPNQTNIKIKPIKSNLSIYF